MPNSITSTVVINVLDRELKIKCPKDKIAELQTAASYLDDKMRQIHNGNKLIPIDRIAITAALNIAHELITLEEYLTNLKTKLENCHAPQ